MNNNPLFYKGLIVCFGTLYALVAFISFWHCIAFCLVGNPVWISVMMSFAFEVGLAATLFSVLTTDNKNNYVAWILMTFLTGVQVIGNVYSVYKYMVESGTKFYTYINDSMLHWFVEDVPNNEIMSIIAIILGALLPIVALLMTAMVSNNLKLWLNKKTEAIPLPSVPVPDNEFSNIPESPEEVDPDIDVKDAPQSTEAKEKTEPTREDFENLPEVPSLDKSDEDMKEREEFYQGLEDLSEQENEMTSEDFNLDFQEEDRSNDKPIQEAVADSPVADVSILAIDNQPALESASETIEPRELVKYPLKGKVNGSEEVIDVMNRVSQPDPDIQDLGQAEDTSDIEQAPLSDMHDSNIDVIKRQQGPFSLFRPGQ